MFSESYIDTIQVAKQTGVDGSGRPSYGNTRPVKCKIRNAAGKVRTDGILVEANHIIKCADTYITISDQITLPDGSTYNPQSVRSSTLWANNQTVVEIIL